MADIVQTYILKVNIGCCNACPRKLQKLLLKNKGVEKFEIDEEKSIVSVTGKINLYKLFKDIKKKINKNAELIKKERSDSEQKQQSEKEESNSEKKQQSEESQEHMAPPEQVSEDISSRDQNIYHPGYYCPRMMQYAMPPPPPPPPFFPPPHFFYCHPY